MGPARAADVVSIEATATVALPVMPPAKLGGRDLTYCFGDLAAQVLRDEIVREWADLKAFREVADEGGTYRLDVVVKRVERAYREVPSEGADARTFTMRLVADCTWSGGDGEPLVVPIDLSRKMSLDDAPGKRELQDTLRDLFRELGERSFGQFYEGRFFRPIGGGGTR